MLAFVQEESKLTERYQTTVPSGVRKQLGVGKGDHLRYRLDTLGRVYLENARDESDPVLGKFLDLLEADMLTHADRVLASGNELRSLHERMAGLVGHVEVDLDAALSPDDE